MDTFRDSFFHRQYSTLEGLGDRLGEIKSLIGREKFRPILSDMYHDNEIDGGRPHVDEILVVRMMVLQGWYGLSDYEAERQANDRVSFRHSLNYPGTIPDRSTIRGVRERLASQGKVHLIWNKLQRQRDEKGY